MDNSTMSGLYNQSDILSIQEQQKVISLILSEKGKSRFHERVLIDHGSYIAGAASLMATYVVWRTGMRTFGLGRYNFKRLSTMSPVLISCIVGSSFHYGLVVKDLFSLHRPESYVNFAMKSYLGHTASIILNGTTAMLGPLVGAMSLRLIPNRYNIYSIKHWTSILGYTVTKSRFGYKSMMKAYVVTSILMLALGAGEYGQTVLLLKKFDRETISIQPKTSSFELEQ